MNSNVTDRQTSKQNLFPAWIMTSALFITSAATSSQPRAPLYLRQWLDAAAAISCSVIRRCVMNWPITTQHYKESFPVAGRHLEI